MIFTEGLSFEEVYDDVLNKIHAEMDEYTSKLKNEKPDKIIKNAYQIACKDEIILVLENSIHFDEAVFVRLSKMKHPLEWLYQQWLKSNFYLSDVIEECIEYSIDRVGE